MCVCVLFNLSEFIVMLKHVQDTSYTRYYLLLIAYVHLQINGNMKNFWRLLWPDFYTECGKMCWPVHVLSLHGTAWAGYNNSLSLQSSIIDYRLVDRRTL